MITAAIYKMNKRGYLLHSHMKTVSGFGIASDPFIQIAENDVNAYNIASAIKKALNNNAGKVVPDPKDWSEFSKNFLQKAGLKSSRELNKPTTMYCDVKKENGNIIFTPTKHAEKPDEGFINKSKDEPDIIVSYTASDEEIMQAFELALSRCE